MTSRNKVFKIPREQIKQLIPNMGGCIATDHITVDGMSVGFMYREEPSNDVDSGWRFFSGEETQEYVDNAENSSFYAVNTICNYDPAVIPYLNAPYGSAFGRIRGRNQFESEEFPVAPQ